MNENSPENSPEASVEGPGRANPLPSDTAIQLEQAIEKLANEGWSSDQIVAYITANILKGMAEVRENRVCESRLEAQDAEPGAAPDHNSP